MSSQSSYHRHGGGRLSAGQRRWVQRQLAKGEKTHKAIGAEVGVSQPRISQINKEDAELIQAMRDDIDNEFVGLWIAQKDARLQEYLITLQHCDEILAEEEWSDQHKEWAKIRNSTLRLISEELGQIPSKVQMTVDGKVVTYRIENIDQEKLK